MDKGRTFEMSAALGRNSFWLTAQTAVTGICSLLISMALARMLGPAEYGKYSYVMWLLGILTMVAGYGLPNAMTRYVSDRYSVDPALARQIYRGLLRAGILIALAVTAAFLVATAFPALRVHGLIIALLALQVAPVALSRLQYAAAAGIQNYGLSARIAVISYPLQLLFLFLAVKQGYGLEGILVVMLGLNLLQWILFSLMLRPYFSQNDTGTPAILPLELKQRIRSFAFTAFLLAIMDAVVWQKSEIFFLKQFSTLTAISFYSLAFTLTFMLMQVPLACSNALFPVFSELFGRGELYKLQKGYQASTKALALFTAPIGLAGIVAAPALVELLYGPAYAPAAPLLQMLLIAGILTTFNRPVSTLLYSTEKQSIIFKVSVGLALLNIGLDLLLIPSQGAMGAALANNMAQIIGVVIGLLYLKRYIHYGYPLSAVLRIFASGIVSAVLVYALLLLVPSQPVFVLTTVLLAYPLLYILLLKILMRWTPEDETVYFGLLDRFPPRLQTLGRMLFSSAGLKLKNTGTTSIGL